MFWQGIFCGEPLLLFFKSYLANLRAVLPKQVSMFAVFTLTKLLERLISRGLPSFPPLCGDKLYVCEVLPYLLNYLLLAGNIVRHHGNRYENWSMNRYDVQLSKFWLILKTNYCTLTVRKKTVLTGRIYIELRISFLAIYGQIWRIFTDRIYGGIFTDRMYREFTGRVYSVHTVRWSNFDRLDPKMGVFLQSTEATPCGHVLKWKLTPENLPADTMFMAAIAMVLP
jgi:hypothetical protein